MKKKYRPLKMIDSFFDIIEYLEEQKNVLNIEEGWDNFLNEDKAVTDLKYEYKVELYFSFLRGYVLYEWRKNKQVYGFSEDFYNMLCTMEDFQLDSSIFEYLPYSCFYIELEFSNKYDGIFVKYDKELRCLFFLLLLKYEGTSIFRIEFTENLSIKQIADKIVNEESKKMKKISEKTKMSIVNLHSKIEIVEILSFAIQATMYLCSKNCNIKENEVQKKIYKAPKSSIKDKYSEVRKWDVGYRLSADEKKSIHSFKEEDSSIILGSKRNRPRQHWRRAHWHTYWTGKGRTVKELRFIPPTLVNDINDTIPVVNHLVD